MTEHCWHDFEQGYVENVPTEEPIERCCHCGVIRGQTMREAFDPPNEGHGPFYPRKSRGPQLVTCWFVIDPNMPGILLDLGKEPECTKS